MPYIYQEYPRTMHRFGEGPQTKTVRTDDEKVAALADGWSLLPVLAPPSPTVGDDLAAPAPVVVETDPARDDEAAAPRRRGRPRKESVN